MRQFLLTLVLLCLPSQAFAYGGGHWSSWAHRSWDVQDIPNCTMHLRADRGVTLNGSTVSNWADQTANANDMAQASATSQPTYSATSFNSKPGITWDGSNDIGTVAGLGTAISGFRIPWTVIAAEQWVSLVDNAAAFYWSGGGAGFYRMLNNTSKYRSAIRDDSGDAVTTDNPATDTSAHVLTLINTGTTESLYLDNTGRASDPVNLAGASVGTVTVTTFSLGALGVSSLAANIRYAEILVCTRAISATERFLAEHQIATRQGVTLN